jgi:hypothetical protein
VQGVGETLSYEYDLGDGWFHRITVEHIAEGEESTGGIRLLDGKGACPPEDSTGHPNSGNPNLNRDQAYSKSQP